MSLYLKKLWHELKSLGCATQFSGFSSSASSSLVDQEKKRKQLKDRAVDRSERQHVFEYQSPEEYDMPPHKKRRCCNMETVINKFEQKVAHQNSSIKKLQKRVRGLEETVAESEEKHSITKKTLFKIRRQLRDIQITRIKTKKNINGSFSPSLMSYGSSDILEKHPVKLEDNDKDELEMHPVQLEDNDHGELEMHPVQLEDNENDELEMHPVKLEENDNELKMYPVKYEDIDNELEMHSVKYEDSDNDEFKMHPVKLEDNDKDELEMHPVQLEDNDHNELEMHPVQLEDNENDEFKMHPVKLEDNDNEFKMHPVKYEDINNELEMHSVKYEDSDSDEFTMHPVKLEDNDKDELEMHPVQLEDNNHSELEMHPVKLVENDEFEMHPVKLEDIDNDEFKMHPVKPEDNDNDLNLSSSTIDVDFTVEIVGSKESSQHLSSQLTPVTDCPQMLTPIAGTAITTEHVLESLSSINSNSEQCSDLVSTTSNNTGLLRSPVAMPLRMLKLGAKIMPASEIDKSSLFTVNQVLKMYDGQNIGVMTCKLAELAVFGPDVLKKCTPMGVGKKNLPALPRDELYFIKQAILNNTPSVWDNLDYFEEIWNKQCMSYLGAVCARKRSEH